MKKRVTEKVLIERSSIETILCDQCEKDIRKSGEELYFTAHTHHGRWGNDSHESSEHFDFCSKTCLTEHFTEYLKDAAHSDSYDMEVERTKFIGQ